MYAWSGGGKGRGGSVKFKQISRCILRTRCSERPMHGMKLDVVDRENKRLIFPAWYLVLPMTSKRIIFAGNHGSRKTRKKDSAGCLLLILVVDVPRIAVQPTISKQAGLVRSQVRLTTEIIAGRETK